MDQDLLLGLWRHLVPVPAAVWRNRVRGGPPPAFMSAQHHRVRNLVVTELPRVGQPLTPAWIAQTLDLPLAQVVALLDDLERHLTFLYRNAEGAVEWAYPVTVAETPHRMTFSSGERIYAA